MAETTNSIANQEISQLVTEEIRSTFKIGDIRVEIIQNGREITSPVTESSNFNKKKRKRKSASPISVNQNQSMSLPEREPTKELLENWRIALQTCRQVCCPLPECQLSYCSIRGLLLHYRNCSGQRNDSEIVKCKICCNYVSGRISLAHHNRLLHSGKPAKSLDTFMESQYHTHIHRSSSSDVRITKSMRQVRKPARYREGDPNSKDDQNNKTDDFTQNFSPVSINKSKTSVPIATITRVAPGSYKKEDFPEDVLKSSFLYRMGLTPTDVQNSVLVLEEEVEDKLPSPKKDQEEFKSPQMMCSELRTRFKQLYPRSKMIEKEENGGRVGVENQVVSQLPVVVGKRKRGRPRKIRPEEMSGQQDVNTSTRELIDKSVKRKRKRKIESITPPIDVPDKSNEPTHEFVTITVCGECWAEFPDPESFNLHVRTKHNGTQQEVPTNIVDKEKLMMKEQKAKLQKTMHQCGILTCPNQNCKKPLLSITGYLSHIKNCQPQNEDSISSSTSSVPVKTEQEKERVCRECNSSFFTLSSFEKHAVIRHQGLCRVVGDNRPFTDEERLAAQKKMLKHFGSIPCPNCPKSYVSLQGLQYHLRTCKAEVIFTQFIDTDVSCNVCNVTYSTMQEFRVHAAEKHNGLARHVGDNRPFSNAEKLNILQQMLRVNKKLSCLNKGCTQEFTTTMEYLEHEELCETAKNSESVVCGVCQTGFPTYEQFSNHAMNAHNGLARLNGKKQTFKEEDELMILRKTLQTVKKLHCLREHCGKTFISLGGYQYHTKICGQDGIVTVECETCGKKLREGSLRAHMKMAHPPTVPVKIESEITQQRNAAKRARVKVSKIARKLNSDEDGNILPSKDSEVENFISSSGESDDPTPLPYQKPTQRLTNDLFHEWKKDFESKGIVPCPNNGCNQEFLVLKDLQRHFIVCSHSTMNLCYICQRCGKRCRTETQMQNHMGKHVTTNSNNNGGDVDFKDNTKVQSAYRKCPVPLYRSQDDLEIFHPAAEWTFEFYKKNSSSGLFTHWQPSVSSWSLLNENEYDIFLPNGNESISFQTLDLANNESLKPDWRKLQRFTSDTTKSTCTIFVGGPVWAMSWCPTPTSKSSIQYLALSCHQSMDDVALSSTILNKQGLVQIWKMTNCDGSPQSEFVLGIAHKFGFVWALEWCPSGCWQDGDVENEDLLPRLGLLAAACSDGKIYIYSVPTPNSLTKTTNLPIFKTNPTAILQNEPVLSSGNSGINYQCISISWLRYKGHSKIAGGYTNGYVALWDVTLDSPLLRKMSSTGEVVYGPCQTFRAHSTFVQDVTWAPFSNGIYLATVGSDRQLCFWSTNDLSWPCNSYKHGRLLKMAWSPHWCGAFVSGDDCFSLWRNSMRFVECGYFGNNAKCMIPHNGCIWDLSLSDWLNCAASCDSSGEVVGTVLPPLSQCTNNLKHLCRKRFPIYRTRLINKKENGDFVNEPSVIDENGVHDEDDVNEDDEDEEIYSVCDQTRENNSLNLPTDAQELESENNQLKTTKSQTSYKEIVDNYGLIYVDNVPESSESFSEEEIRRLNNPKSMTGTNVQSFPITSINRIAWNPNLGSHLLLASGGQSGIVRIHRINWIKDESVSKVRTTLQSENLTNSSTTEPENCVIPETVESDSSSEKIEESVENCDSNNAIPIKVNQIEWLHQGNINKIRTALQIQSGQNKHQDGDANEKVTANDVTSGDEILTNCSSELSPSKFLSAQSTNAEVTHS